MVAIATGFVSVGIFTPSPIDPSLEVPVGPNRVIETENLSNQNSKGRLWPAGVESDAVVYEIWRSFQNAVAADDRDTVASLPSYPFRVNYPTDNLDADYRRIPNKRAFLRAYDKIFDDNIKRFIASTFRSDLWARYDGILTPRGEIWIGVHCIGPGRNDCSTGHEVKIRTIHGNSVFIDRNDPADQQ